MRSDWLNRPRLRGERALQRHHLFPDPNLIRFDC